MLSSYITVVGNMVAKPKLEWSNGDARCPFRIAVTERRFDKESAAWVDTSTTFFSITAWRDMAEHVAQTLDKGDRVIVAGRFHSREWTKDERSGVALEIEADVIGPDLRFRPVAVPRPERDAVAEGDQEVTSEVTSADPWRAGAVGVDHQTGEIPETESGLEPMSSSAA